MRNDVQDDPVSIQTDSRTGEAAACPVAHDAARPAAPPGTAPDITCFLYPGWRPHIRPAAADRPWMDAAPEAFPYRCLPLNIANAQGWEVLSPVAFEACWAGGDRVEDVHIRLPDGAPPHLAPVSIFGQGVITFHIMGLFRTSPGWNLWVGGSPNRPKDAIAALSGIVETDWAPFTFTMNWRFTRPNTWVRFEEGEPICFFFPIQRTLMEQVRPRFADIETAPELKAEFERWSRLRDEFQAKVAAEPPRLPSQKWQKHYYRGVDTQGRAHVDDHRTKVRLAAFEPAVEPARCTTPLPATPSAPPVTAEERLALRRREWLLDVMEAHRTLSPKSGTVARYEGMTREEFLHDFYAAGRPVVLGGEMDDWPALERWTPEYLAKVVGPKVIEFQGDRTPDEAYEIHKGRYRREMAFDRFIEMITEQPGNRAYLTAFNSAANRDALRPLQADLGRLPKYLTTEGPEAEGMMWIGPAGTFTPLHHDLTNNLVAQVVGRKRILLIPASDVSRLYNRPHVFSEIADLEAPHDPAAYPRLAEARIFDITLEPGDALFIPIGWWHQVRALDFSVTLTYTNFLWRNDWYASFPTDGSVA